MSMGHPVLGYFSKTFRQQNYHLSIQKTYPTDRYLDFNSNHPKSAKRAVVRALTDRAKNVCSSPELLAEEMDHLGKVLRYNNYPKWMIDQHGRNSSQRKPIDPDTDNEVEKSVFISAPYFQV